MLKASAGGGGRGIRVAYNKDQLEKEYDLVKQEAKISFNDDSLYLEKFVENPRHVEIQVLADEFGNCIHLGERDCSVQRRNQKVLEETPSPILDDKTRKKMGEVAINAVKQIGYTNAGTIEFLVDKNKDFYFMEMNTRVQVEHPVTEMVTGVDIIKEQIKIASGEVLSYKQKDITITGHSMEVRINAEDPDRNFMPCPGTITDLHLPGGNGVRIAKIIVHGKDRNESIAKMRSAIAELVVDGIKTNADFILKILSDEDFKNNNYDTSFIAKKFGIKSN